ncbi:MAG: hypothetical protein Athens101426_96 [Parcubacteria group bacterium Athens1014_26]|nr:MAG: hypothetical protein Athens101426_96 [Parcubacteria group bacterium Athens1014_26]
MKIKKALTFRASSIGDALMGKYFLENIHVQFPEAVCGLLVGSRGKMIKELLAGYPWLKVVEASRRSPLSLFYAARDFWGSDITLIQYSENKFSTPSKIFARLITKGGGLMGFNDGWRFNNFIYDQLLLYKSEREKRAIFFYEQDALKAAGLGIPVTELSLEFNKSDVIVRRLKLEPNKYIVIHLFAGNDGRGLSPEKKREILNLLSGEFGKDVNIVCTGSEKELDVVQDLAVNLRGIVLARNTNIKELINLIYFSRAVLSVDTGAAHIAAHLNKPLLVLTRCESYYSWWSKDQYHKNLKVFCNFDACKEGHLAGKFPLCLNLIDFNLVVEDLKRIIGIKR